jgi:hypothetical protein
MLRDRTRRSTVTLLLSLTALAASGHAAAGGAGERSLAALQQQFAQMQARLQQLVEENRSLREEQQHLERRLAQLALVATPAPGAAPTAVAFASAAALASQPPPASPSAASPSAASPSAGPQAARAEGPRLWGYGEVYYANPTREGRRTRADLARAVFGLGYSFDERTEFNSEFEVEHAVASAGDVGEFDVEQFYVDRRLGDSVSARGGLLLMPFGLINEHHEPTRYFGVQRNFVETLIIPSTWREGGVSLRGDTRLGLGWNVGLTTGFDLSKWQFTSAFPPYASALELSTSGAAPLQAAHQELSLANARHLSQYAAASYYGVPALLLGGAITTGKAVGIALPPGAGGATSDPRVTLWEAHARWTPSKLDLSALYARGSISDTGTVNAAHAGAVNPVPSSFYGYFLEGAYELWEQGGYRAVPFLRLERYNLGASYAGTSGPVLPSGLVPLSEAAGDLGYWPANHDRVWTAGTNFYLGAHVVLKGDYQWFESNASFRRFDLGLGVSF